MTLQDICTIICVNIVMFGALATLVYWMVNRIDSDVKSMSAEIKADIKSITTRLDGHAMRIDQLYKMFVDLLKKE